MEDNIIKVEPINTTQAKVETELATGMIALVETVKFDTQEQVDYAGTLLRDVKGRIKQLDEKRKSITNPLDVARKMVMDLFRVPVDSYTRAEGLLKRGILDYQDRQEKKRRLLEEKLRKQADDERRRKEEQAREWEKKERIKREEAKKALAAGDEEAARKAEASAEKMAEKAEERQTEADTTQAPVIASMAQAVEGIHSKKRWYAEIVDISAVPVDYLLPNMPMLTKMAMATKGKVKVPGVVFKEEKILASRAA